MPKFLESSRLWFRAPERADVPLFTRWLQDPNVSRNLLIGRFPFNEENEMKWIEAMSSGPPSFEGKSDVVLAFGPNGGTAPIGSTGLHRISWLHRHAEWGILIGETEQWGKGYGREAAGAMLRYAFNILNLNRVYLRVNADNERGIRAYRAAGFVDEGVARQATFVHGRYVDQLQMAALRDDWKG